MLSLTEDLRKFENLACQNELDGVITIEDGFSSGAVTVRDLVRENHTIVNEFKRMKNVFINYTKLNQKIYDKITEHELSFGSSVIKLGNMNNFFEKTIDGTLDTMKQIYEDTVHQNRLAGERISRELDPIWAELRNKVDVAHFNLTIRNLSGSSSEHDSSEMLRQESLASKVDEHLRLERDKERMSELQPNSESPIVLKKSPAKDKKLSAEEITSIKTEVLGQLSSINESIGEQVSKMLQKLEEVRKGLLTTIQETYHQTSAKINDLEGKHYQEIQRQGFSLNCLTELLNTRTSPQIWEAHKRAVLEEIAPRLELLKNKQDALSQQQFQLENKLTLKLDELHNQFSCELANTESRLSSAHSSLQHKMAQEQSLLSARLDEISRLHHEFKISTEKGQQDMNRIIALNKQETLNEFLDVRDKIKDLSVTIEATVLRQVVRSFQKNINKLELDMTELHRLEKDTGRRIDIAFEHLNDVKEVTGRKANFSDIVGLFEKKASKDEVTELKGLLSSTDLLPDKTIHMHTATATAQKTSSRFGGDSHRLKSTTVVRSNVPSPDRSLSTSVALGSGRERPERRQNKETRLLSKRFRYRPNTTEQPLFN